MEDGLYDIFIQYSYGIHTNVQADRRFEGVPVKEGQSTEKLVSFDLGELMITAYQSDGTKSGDVRVNVYPTDQHESPLAFFYPDRSEEQAHPLEEGVYDVYVQYWNSPTAGWGEVWFEDISITAGEITEQTIGQGP